MKSETEELRESIVELTTEIRRLRDQHVMLILVLGKCFV